ncbi:hypothetical protein PUNSTDRAFT_54573 [Punctularia strigosozonata HHB-11173 SS5]|uniref:uncharacterized protein n=1 Tax=Punctularia strigosozonata (strain HHB-11173) TaxID=741275 RepID=UPI00044168BF|nr:uncharacterized protein PUNSTDRAFT_54573 [Punctularia strigosozonata HHB-11173 SS5]EIN05639.1 hypothetical protein PUNSTDRAFT_54573 [Punctularia strigosozonata HHB-11173 SS5]
MLRLLASRRALAVTAAAAVATIPEDKLPIYPKPDPQVVLVHESSELEKQIGTARRAVTQAYANTHARAQDLVSKWIGVEHAVESRVKSILDPTEPLTPGILYVGVATLTGSIVARNRFFLTRLVLPPALLVLSAHHFLPKTSANLADYLGSLEDAHLPRLAQAHETAKAHSAMTWERIKDATAEGRAAAGEKVVGAAAWVEGATGLKLRDAMGWSEARAKTANAKTPEMVEAAKEKVAHVVEIAKGKAAEAVEVAKSTAIESKAAVKETTDDAEKAASKKVEEVKRLV